MKWEMFFFDLFSHKKTEDNIQHSPNISSVFL